MEKSIIRAYLIKDDNRRLLVAAKSEEEATRKARFVSNEFPQLVEEVNNSFSVNPWFQGTLHNVELLA